MIYKYYMKLDYIATTNNKTMYRIFIICHTNEILKTNVVINLYQNMNVSKCYINIKINLNLNILNIQLIGHRKMDI